MSDGETVRVIPPWSTDTATLARVRDRLLTLPGKADGSDEEGEAA